MATIGSSTKPLATMARAISSGSALILPMADLIAISQIEAAETKTSVASEMVFRAS
ncbi:MAG: hypothetical protein IPN05_04475 [Sulfuritalea sp.]|nr:hypothetical protein [Sulfuritalea sp.]MBK9349479.1 hypothetical protein [Sulfuritalea sp.]